MDNRMPSLVPEQFGPLSGIRILSSGTLIAQPFAATLAAEMGAEVIRIERPGEGDVWKSLTGLCGGSSQPAHTMPSVGDVTLAPMVLDAVERFTPISVPFPIYLAEVRSRWQIIPGCFPQGSLLGTKIAPDEIRTIHGTPLFALEVSMP